MEICHLQDVIFRTLMYGDFYLIQSDIKKGEIFLHTLVSEKVTWKDIYELMLTVCNASIFKHSDVEGPPLFT